MMQPRDAAACRRWRRTLHRAHAIAAGHRGDAGAGYPGKPASSNGGSVRRAQIRAAAIAQCAAAAHDAALAVR